MKHFIRKAYLATFFSILAAYILTHVFQEWLNPKIIFSFMKAGMIC